MSVVRPWGRLSDHDLDFASADSAMGHAADLALGIALARPERKVVCLNGDGSMLMCLGTLATAVGMGATNFILFVADNGEFEISGLEEATYDVSTWRQVENEDGATQWKQVQLGVIDAPAKDLELRIPSD